MPECPPEDYSRSPLSCLSKSGPSLGIVVTAGAGFISLLAILFVLWIIKRNAVRRLIVSLLFADAIQAIGAVLNVRWVPVRTASIRKGIIKTVGATGIAFATLAIAVYISFALWAIADFVMKLT